MSDQNDQEIVAHWERLCAAAEEPGISDAEYERRCDAGLKFMRTTPHHTRVICDAYAREFPDGPPPGTPGMTDWQRQRIVDLAVRPAQRRRN
jgi:hypothetical protein